MASEETLAINQGLSQLGRTISADMGQINKSTMSFRDAAYQQTKSLSSVMKDLYSAVVSQKRDLGEIDSSIDASANETESGLRDTSRATQEVNDELGTILSVQYKTLRELEIMNKNLEHIGDNTSDTALGRVFSSIFGTSWFDTLKTTLGIAGLGIAGAASFGPGGGGGVERVSNPVMAKDIFNYLTQEKKVDREHAIGMLANIQNESQFNSGAFNKNDVNGPSGGLFQHHDNYKTGEHRFSDMVKAAGPDWQKNWKGQIDFALTENEMKKYLQTPVSSGREAAASFVYHFEKPLDQAGEAAKRAGNVTAVERAINDGASPSSVNNVTNTTNITPSDPGRQQLPSSTPSVTGPGGQIQPLSSPTKNGNLPDSMLQSIGQGHRLQPQAAQAYQQMVEAARKEGITWSVTDSYRDYASQVKLAQEKGLYSQGGLAATPGTSNHGWGMAVDLGGGANEKSSKQNQWLQANAAKFGFYNIAREPWHWEFRGQGATQQTQGSPATPGLGAGASSDTSQPLDPRLASGRTEDITNYAASQVSNILNSYGMTSGAGMGMGLMPSMGGLEIGNIINSLTGSMLPLMGDMVSLSPQTTAEQLAPQTDTAAQIQAAAVQEKVERAMQTKPAEIESRETEPSNFAQSPQRQFPQGSFSEYNTDNHLYPEWGSMVSSMYGITNSLIKTSLV